MLLPITYGVWLLSEILLNRLMRAGSSGEKSTDRSSLTAIWITIIISVTAAILVTQNIYFPIGHGSWIVVLGLILIWLGVILRLMVVRALGKFFTVNVAIRSEHRLKTDGIYAYLRHPSYSASLLSFVGFGLALNNWISIAVVLIPVTAAFLYRIRIEEALLAGHFGQEYLDYSKRTRKLIPFIF